MILETTKFELPPVIAELVLARDRVRDHYGVPDLTFTLDGKLVGDIGEAVAAEMFGLTLKTGGGTGIDAFAPDGRTVQIKATGTGRGAVFRHVDTRADHLIFIEFDFKNLRGEIVFNGPEHIALQDMPESWPDQRPVSNRNMRRLNALVLPEARLPLVDASPEGNIPDRTAASG
ncbi:hypothetical protein QA648_10855 [Rhizobium sp. CB3171]|uniref:DUF6998 domain-containing protein n=1 Tax=Rhizobium sp. CB3171 TaxID=3039157 RepID=UPI0024B24FE6|nr:hypothetical protein [Rhizobium sp. CB3171]WFU00671.1 hypothetical protein QA648_10855 [Rhizobium sp. CB3171]